jgi:hypothetical protein
MSAPGRYVAPEEREEGYANLLIGLLKESGFNLIP